ncbi:MAG TPA: hypothetical protein VLJ68_00675 [Chitinophagaceae bacterium]|nr:hypothetical protein [Chitinophagaceae bacterium]
MKEEKKKDKQTPVSGKKQSLKEKVRKHINDKNDVITDEDIRNADVGSEVVKELHIDKEEILTEKSKKKKATPWDVLEEEKG